MSDEKLNTALKELAELAGVPTQARSDFYQDIKSAIEGARLLAGMNWSKPATADVSALLKDITDDAQILSEKIQEIRKQAGKWNKEDFARMAFVGALHDKGLSISDALASIKTISESAADAAQEVIKPGPREKRPSFNAFATALYLAARQAGGNLTIYKSAEKWSGSLLDAFSILESHLPDNFSPHGDKGRILDGIVGQYRSHFASEN